MRSICALVVALAATPALATDAPDLLQPLRTGERAPADAAVVIGIETYPFVADVPYARRDAQAMYQFLVYTRGVPADRVRLLDNGASREQILDAVGRAGEQAGRDGTVWIYFAGHGAADTDSGDRLLLGDDVRQDAAAFTARGVSVHTLERLAAKGGASVNLFVDACYAGLGRGGEELLAGKRFLVPTYASAPNARVVEWNAAGPNELSGPIDAVRHGAFTYFAVGALRGWADGQLDGVPDGQVTADEARLYVNASLRTLQNTEQQSQLTAADPSRTVLSASSKLEAGPTSSQIADLRDRGNAPVVSPSGPAPRAAPSGPLDITQRAAVTAWVESRLSACYEQHADGDPDLRQWWVRFRVHHKRGLGGIMLQASEKQDGGATEGPTFAMYTCLRNHLRDVDVTLPKKATTYTSAFTLPLASAATPAAPEPSPVTPAPAEVRPDPVRPDPRGDVRWTAPGLDVTVRIPGDPTLQEPAAPARPAPAAVPTEVRLVVRNPDNQWADVRVNGQVVAEFRNEREHTVTLRPGVHTVEFVEFMGSEPFSAGRLTTGDADEIIFGIEDELRVTCYNHDGWQPR